MGIGDGATLRVDPELLARYGDELEIAAAGLPEAPEPFIVSGTDPISLAIAGRLPDVEGAIQTALPQVKADATATASNVIAAAGKYKGTDEQLAAEYAKHQFDQAGSPGSAGGAGSAGGGGDAMGQMGQIIGMPMQMASQAAKMPMQAMSAVASTPQAVMQGVQQIGQMAGGLGKSDGVSAVPADAVEAKDAEQKDDEQEKRESQPSAAAGTAHAERAPEVPATSPAPQQNSPRHEAPDPEINL